MSAETGLEDLLQDVLKDFNVPVPPQPQQQQGPVVLTPPPQQQQEQEQASSSSTQPPTKAAPSGLGLSGLPQRPTQPPSSKDTPNPSGLGPSGLPQRPTPKPKIAAASPSPAPSGGLAFDPLRKGSKPSSSKQQQHSDGASPSPSSQQQHAHTSEGANKRQLPPDVQRLADDLLKLVNESSIGDRPPQQGSTEPPSSSSTAQGDGQPASTIHGLMEHTKRTVAAQSKFARGERGPESGPSTSAGAQQPGGGLLSALGGDLGGLGGLLGGLGGDAEGEGGMGSGMVDMIMRQLLSKEVLYTPLKEIRDKYPPWLESTSLPAEEAQRYHSQYEAIQAVVRQYDEDPDNFAKLTDLIQEMQKHGDPPAAIVEEIGGSINQSGLFPSDGGAPEESGGDPGFSAEDLNNLQLPPDLFKDLPQELLKDLPPEMQKDCCIM